MKLQDLKKALPNLVIVPGHDPTEYDAKYLKPFFKDGVLSAAELAEIIKYEKQLFTGEFDLAEESMPQFIPARDGGNVGSVK